MVPATVPLIQNLGIEIQRAKKKHGARAVIYILVAISNIFISVPCIKLWGASGAAVGTAVSLIAGNIIFMNWYYHKKLGLNIINFCKQMARIFMLVIFITIFGLVTTRLIPTNDRLIIFMLQICVYSVVYIVAMWIWGMNEKEKSLIADPLNKIRRKSCGK